MCIFHTASWSSALTHHNISQSWFILPKLVQNVLKVGSFSEIGPTVPCVCLSSSKQQEGCPPMIKELNQCRKIPQKSCDILNTYFKKGDKLQCDVPWTFMLKCQVLKNLVSSKMKQTCTTQTQA